MKKRVVTTEIIDDFDGEPGAITVPFAFEGVRYEVDLSEVNRKEMAEMLAPYIENGRRVGGRKVASKSKSKSRSRARGPKPADVRAWAAENGVEVSPTGRVPQAVVEQYKAAHLK